MVMDQIQIQIVNFDLEVNSLLNPQHPAGILESVLSILAHHPLNYNIAYI
jgi:hypothetical protein